MFLVEINESAQETDIIPNSDGICETQLQPYSRDYKASLEQEEEKLPLLTTLVGTVGDLSERIKQNPVLTKSWCFTSTQ